MKAKFNKDCELVSYDHHGNQIEVVNFDKDEEIDLVSFDTNNEYNVSTLVQLNRRFIDIPCDLVSFESENITDNIFLSGWPSLGLVCSGVPYSGPFFGGSG